MKKTVTNIWISVATLFFIMQYIFAINANPDPIEIILPDGNIFQIRAFGNSWYNYAETLDGYTIIQNADANWTYAIRDIDGQMIPTNVLIHPKGFRSTSEEIFLVSIGKHVRPSQEVINRYLDQGSYGSIDKEAAQRLSIRNKMFQRTTQNNVLLLLIDYPDLVATETVQSFDDMMNLPGYEGGYEATGSFNDYYQEVSYGEFGVQAVIFGWYRSINGYQYYGEQNGDAPAVELVREAVDAAEAAGVDFSLYDNDGDGEVDGLFIVHSGPGAEEGYLLQYIWSHRWFLSATGATRTYDGVLIDAYTIEPEKQYNRHTGIGVYCHEYGHAIGLPDLYDTNGGSEGIGKWGAMGGGSWLNQGRTPSHFSPWSKEYLGWINPTTITSNGNYTFDAIETNYSAFYRITVPTDASEYFLLENRQSVDFDAYLPGDGLLIWHVDTDKTSLYPGSNTVNADENHKGVDVEAADGNNDMDNENNSGDSGDPYPGSTSNTTFDDFSNPNSRDYSGNLSNIAVTNISSSSASMTADITISNSNDPPVADAGSDMSVDENSIVTLDGSGSSDPDGDPITYLWTVPAGITLSSTTAASPTFTAPEVQSNTDYTFTLVVNDGTSDSAPDDVIITVEDVTPIPVHFIPAWSSTPYLAMNIFVTSVTLDGVDLEAGDEIGIFDGAICVGAGVLTETIPTGGYLSLIASTDDPTTTEIDGFTVGNTITFMVWDNSAEAESNICGSTFTVGDGNFSSLGTAMVVLACPPPDSPPVADAGTDQTVDENSIVTLDGSGSSDPDGDPITYLWTAPAGITLSSTTTVGPTFTAPDVQSNTDYTFTLIVNDGTSDSDPDDVIITVEDVTPMPVHFIPAWSNNPYLAMNIFVTSVTLDGVDLEAGDEIGIFDGAICVGAGVLTETIPTGGYLSLIASTDDPTTTEIDGFTVGNTITFMVWDNSAEAESNICGSTFSVGNGNFSSLGTAMVDLACNSTVEQLIFLMAGWNIFSLYVEPEETNMDSILSPVIDSGCLVKVQDEAGNAIELLPLPIGWINNIGNWQATEAYYARLSCNFVLSNQGSYIPLPLDVPLGNGWNLVPFPLPQCESAMSIVQGLISAGELVKVQDEAGNAIEQLPEPIGWINNIGNFCPGKGYYFRVNTATLLTYSDPGRHSDQVIQAPAQSESKYYLPVYQNNPYLAMNIYVLMDQVDNTIYQDGFELAVYDGENCVGVTVFSESLVRDAGYISIITSMDDPSTAEIDGFIAGHNIQFRLWDGYLEQVLVNRDVGLHFEGQGTGIVNLVTALSVEDYDAVPESFALYDCYPNPFNPGTTISYDISKACQVTVLIHDMLGKEIRQLVNKSLDPGKYKIYWDGLTGIGEPVPSGIYFYTINGDEFLKTKKMILLK